MTDFPNLPTETTPQGEQIITSGVRPITGRDRLADRAARPMRPRRNPNVPQKPCDLGLFDMTARNQLDLLEFICAET